MLAPGRQKKTTAKSLVLGTQGMKGEEAEMQMQPAEAVREQSEDWGVGPGEQPAPAPTRRAAS